MFVTYQRRLWRNPNLIAHRCSQKKSPRRKILQWAYEQFEAKHPGQKANIWRAKQRAKLYEKMKSYRSDGNLSKLALEEAKYQAELESDFKSITIPEGLEVSVRELAEIKYFYDLLGSHCFQNASVRPFIERYLQVRQNLGIAYPNSLEAKKKIIAALFTEFKSKGEITEDYEKLSKEEFVNEFLIGAFPDFSKSRFLRSDELEVYRGLKSAGNLDHMENQEMLLRCFVDYIRIYNEGLWARFRKVVVGFKRDYQKRAKVVDLRPKGFSLLPENQQKRIIEDQLITELGDQLVRLFDLSKGEELPWSDPGVIYYEFPADSYVESFMQDDVEFLKDVSQSLRRLGNRRYLARYLLEHL